VKGPVDEYLQTIDRMEPDIHPVDPAAYYASASISLKRIADALEKMAGLFSFVAPVVVMSFLVIGFFLGVIAGHSQ